MAELGRLDGAAEADLECRYHWGALINGDSPRTWRHGSNLKDALVSGTCMTAFPVLVIIILSSVSQGSTAVRPTSLFSLANPRNRFGGFRPVTRSVPLQRRLPLASAEVEDVSCSSVVCLMSLKDQRAYLEKIYRMSEDEIRMNRMIADEIRMNAIRSRPNPLEEFSRAAIDRSEPALLRVVAFTQAFARHQRVRAAMQAQRKLKTEVPSTDRQSNDVVSKAIDEVAIKLRDMTRHAFTTPLVDGGMLFVMVAAAGTLAAAGIVSAASP